VLAFASLLVCGAALSAATAKLTAREVTGLLFKAEHGSHPDLSGKDLSGLDLAELDFKGANLSGADLYGADLSGANLAAADLKGARLDRATIIKAEFSSANLEGATLLRPNTTMTFSPDPRDAPRFSGAKMARANIIVRLVGADFRWADLTGAVFGTPDVRAVMMLTSQVVLDACDFSEATLQGTSLTGASLRFARFNGATLKGADLRGADLTRASFAGADLTGADVTGANLDEADFSAARGVTEIKGLAQARNADRAVMTNGAAAPAPGGNRMDAESQGR
jgi:uncharacterized protein YjbI with pentapeptide repeats